jgi:DNA-binding NarL/FixJ family response regulator
MLISQVIQSQRLGGEMNKPSIEIICEMLKFKVGLEQFVSGLGYKVESCGEIAVLVDARMGTALRHLEKFPKTKSILIITDNSCGLYHHCLMQYHPEGIVFNGDGANQVAQAVTAVHSQQPFNNLPKSRIRFSPTDLKVARELARGLTTPELAQLFNVSQKTAEGYVTEVLDKARASCTTHLINNRTQFALWFWGQDHVLDTP